MKHVKVMLAALLVLASPAEAARKGTLVWKFQNHSGQTISIELIDQANDNYWPGNGTAYTIPANGVVYTQAIRCVRRAKICYGGWIPGTGIYWGVGQGGKQACTDCCYTCGGGATRVMVLNPPTLPVESTVVDEYEPH